MRLQIFFGADAIEPCCSAAVDIGSGGYGWTQEPHGTTTQQVAKMKGGTSGTSKSAKDNWVEYINQSFCGILMCMEFNGYSHVAKQHQTHRMDQT